MVQPGQLTIEVRERADRVILVLEGELDLLNASQLEDALDDPAAERGAMLVLDLERLHFMDSTGLRAIFAAVQKAGERGQRFALTPGSDQVQRLLSVTGVAKSLPIIAGPDGVPA